MFIKSIIRDGCLNCAIRLLSLRNSTYLGVFIVVLTPGPLVCRARDRCDTITSFLDAVIVRFYTCLSLCSTVISTTAVWRITELLRYFAVVTWHVFFCSKNSPVTGASCANPLKNCLFLYIDALNPIMYLDAVSAGFTPESWFCIENFLMHFSGNFGCLFGGWVRRESSYDLCSSSSPFDKIILTVKESTNKLTINIVLPHKIFTMTICWMSHQKMVNLKNLP